MSGLLLSTLLAVLAATALYHRFKPLPPGLSRPWPEHPLHNPRLLEDHTWMDETGKRHLDHEIFDEVLRLIGQARRLVVVDMFLFNDVGGGPDFRPMARELSEALLARRAASPGLVMVVITDPLNTLYGGTRSPWLEQLRGAGITVVETDLTALRDPTPLWSTPWRLCLRWFGNNPDGGWLPSPTGEPRVTLRSYLALLNLKANHRKTLVVDEDGQLRGLVSCANIHDGSSRHSNVALTFGGPAARDLLDSELAVAALSGVSVAVPPGLDGACAAGDHNALGRVVTEGRIRDAALAMIDGTAPGDRLDVAAFYLAHRGLIDALARAQGRGVAVRVLLDANKDAFGLEKRGVPNRPAARDLHRAGVTVRWASTHGEQFHNKAMMTRDAAGHWQLLLGSANFTRRNLDDYNLETNILVRGQGHSPLAERFAALFDRTWRQGPEHPATLSLPYEAFRDHSALKYWRYRAMEATGLCAF